MEFAFALLTERILHVAPGTSLGKAVPLAV